MTARVSLRGQSCWTVQDPVASRFYQLREEEQFVLDQLAEPLSWEELRRRVAERFAPRRVSQGQLESFVALLHREGLLVSTAGGQAPQLLQRGERKRREGRWRRLASPLAIRFRGFNPAPLLRRLAPCTAWLFTPAAIGASLLLMAATVMLLLTRLPQLAAELPALHQFFTPASLAYLAVAVGLSKVLHELGHALALTHLGGRCRELGVMLLVLVPCLYCNVSDAWLLPGKWRRIAVSLAGLWVDLLLACAGLWLWWLTEPGRLHSLCLSLTVVCSVNSLLLNGNPLLRYDGYFALADYWEIPNLFQQSRDRLRQLVVRWTTGLELPRQASSGAPDRLLIPYAVASIAYRWFVVVAIWWVLRQGLRPWGLEALAHLLLTVTAAAMLAAPLAAAGRFLARPRQGERTMQWKRVTVSGIVLAAMLVGVMLVPLPSSVTAPATLRPADLVSLRVVAPGVLRRAAPEGAELREHDAVAELESVALQRELAAARAAERLHRQRVEQLRAGQLRDAQSEADLVVAEQSLAFYSQRAKRLATDAQRLTIRAPQAGRLYAARPRRDGTTWQGAVLDEANRGASLAVDDLVGFVGSPDQMEAVAIVPQRDIARLRPGQTAEVAAAAATGGPLRGVVREIAEVDADRPGDELIQLGLVAGADEPQGGRAAGVVFQVRVALHKAPPSLPLGGVARVKIHTPSATLWQRASRRWAALRD